MEQRTYIAIDLKSFYASVECVERGLDPMNAHLVVADESRTEKTICLAVSPALKAQGIPGRPRLFEVIQRVRAINADRQKRASGRRFQGASHFASELQENANLALDYIVAPPRMGVVANMADRIAVMYAGKIVEYGTADEIFYQPAHPYTWALLASIPDLDTKEKLESIPGTPPNMLFPPKGDAFAPRNKYAMAIDFEEEPPLFEISPTHYAATWLLHPNAPRVEPPRIVTERIKRMRALGGEA